MNPINVVTLAAVLVLSLGCSGNTNKPANKKEVPTKDIALPELSDAQKKEVMKRCAELKAEDEAKKGRKHTLEETKAWVKDCEAILDAERLAKSREEDRNILAKLKALNNRLDKTTQELDNIQKKVLSSQLKQVEKIKEETEKAVEDSIKELSPPPAGSHN